MNRITLFLSLFALALSGGSGKAQTPGAAEARPGLWDLARTQAPRHRFSTLFTAHDVRNHLLPIQASVRHRDLMENVGSRFEEAVRETHAHHR